MSDKAALRGVDVVAPLSQSTTSKEIEFFQKVKDDKKGRTATKGLRISEAMYLEFDNLGRPMGKWRLKYGQHAGFCMRKFNINWNWKDVSEGTRKLMWEDTMSLFHIVDEKRLRKKFLSLVAKRFRDFKSKLVSGWITKTRQRAKFEDDREPPEIWKHIKVEDWKLFKQNKTSSPAKRKHDKAVECAKKNEHHHHLGQNDFSTARPIWIKDGFYPGSTPTSESMGNESTSLVTIDVNRADDWFCAMHSKDKKTGKYVVRKPKTQEVAEKYLELKKKQKQGEWTPERNKDALYFALGEKEDHPSRARGFGGVNVSVKQAFGAPPPKIKGSRKSGTSSEDREALKKELKEELRNEMRSEIRSKFSSFLQEMGLPTSKLPDDLTQMYPNLDRAHLNHQKPTLTRKIKNDSSCRLHLEDPHNGVSYEVARGKTFPGEVCHQGLVESDQLRVKVAVVPKEFETLPLPVPVPAYDLNLLGDAVGSFVQWPIALVRIENEDGHERNEHELMGSDSHVSRLSATPIKMPKESTVQSLSPDCQWLNTFLGTMAVGETYNIYFEAKLFYYKEEGLTVVHEDDIKQFLAGSELNIPIIQIFIRALQEDLVKAERRPKIGWLCPDATADTRLRKKAGDAIVYISNAFLKSDCNNDEFILAPIIDSKHWLLLAICPQTYYVYEFDSITLKDGRKLYMKMVVLSALRRYKMRGGQMKIKRKEPLWKSMKCPQQNGCKEYGYFVMRFMYDIVKTCMTASDLEKVWISHTEESYTYTDNEIN
ncbi:hypothetical protein RND81_10G037700 [Saponaria officinalis]